MATKKKTTDNERPDDIKREPFKRQLEVVLKREEVEERSQRMAHLVSDHDVKEANFKDQAADNKRELSRISNLIRELSGEVRSGKTYRDVECERVFNWTRGTVQDVRVDTGEVMSGRAMSEAEKQKALPFEQPPKPGDLDDEFGGKPEGEDGEAAE